MDKEERIAPPTADTVLASDDDSASSDALNRAAKKKKGFLAGAGIVLCAVLLVCGICFAHAEDKDSALQDEQPAAAQSQSPSISQGKAKGTPPPIQHDEEQEEQTDDQQTADQESADDALDTPPVNDSPNQNTEDAEWFQDTPPGDDNSGNTQSVQQVDDVPDVSQPPAASSQNNANPPEHTSNSSSEVAEEEPTKPETITVNVVIDSSRAVPFGYAASLGGGAVTVPVGASAYDALCATGVAVGGSSSYVSSIGGLSEFACGNNSGWLYFINGVSPSVGCGSWVVQNGDTVSWIYTIDLGNDL